MPIKQNTGCLFCHSTTAIHKDACPNHPDSPGNEIFYLNGFHRGFGGGDPEYPESKAYMLGMNSGRDAYASAKARLQIERSHDAEHYPISRGRRTTFDKNGT